MKLMMLVFALLVPTLSLAQPAAPLAPVKPEVTVPAPAAPAAPAVAAPTAKPATPVSSLDTNGDGKVDAAETAAATAKDSTVKDVIKDGTDVISAAKGVKDSGTPKAVAIAVLLGAIFKLLLSLIKVLAKNVAWFKSQDGKRVVKYSTLALGVLATLTANLAFGMGWVDAIMILLSGPIAVAIHEYTSDSKPVEPEKA